MVLRFFQIFFSILLFQNALFSWDFIDKKGDTIVFDWVESGSLREEEKLFLHSFLTGYSTFSEKDLGVSNKKSFLKEAFQGIREDFEKKEGYVLCAKHAARIVSVCEFKKADSDTQFYVAQLAVDPAYWNRGIGKETVFAIVQRFPEIIELVAICRVLNTAGQKFFKAIGFEKSAYMHAGYDPKKYTGFHFMRKESTTPD